MGKRAGCFACLPGDCCVALPHNATGLSAVNDWYTHLIFLMPMLSGLGLGQLSIGFPSI